MRAKHPRLTLADCCLLGFFCEALLLPPELLAGRFLPLPFAFLVEAVTGTPMLIIPLAASCKWSLQHEGTLQQLKAWPGYLVLADTARELQSCLAGSFKQPGSVLRNL